MGRVASAGDNAAMESFFSLLQKNVLNRRRWRTRGELRHAIVYWIEHTYNRRRRQRGLGKLTPVEFELAFAPNPQAVARGMISHNHRQPKSRQTRPPADSIAHRRCGNTAAHSNSCLALLLRRPEPELGELRLVAVHSHRGVRPLVRVDTD